MVWRKLWRGEWVALASFSAAALKCQARDAWIRLDAAPQVRPAASGGQQHPVPAPAARCPSLGPGCWGCARRHLGGTGRHGFIRRPCGPVAVRRARSTGPSGWTEVGMTRGFRPSGAGTAQAPRRRIVRALTRTPVASFAAPTLEPPATVMGDRGPCWSAEQVRSLHRCLCSPTRASRYGSPLPPRDSAGAGRGGHLCGARGYKAIARAVCDLTPAMLRHFRCRRVNGSLRATVASTVCATRSWSAPEALDAAAGLVLGPRSRYERRWPSTARP